MRGLRDSDAQGQIHKREYNKEPPATEEIAWKTLRRLGDNAQEQIHKREYSESHHHRVDCL
ncbi:hypothetical protein COE58_22785 [Bacillus cereus]|nr:hypothetical protein COE58_22785 [Bacillus cereus]